MKRVYILLIFLLALLAAGAAWWIASRPEEVPAWKKSWREAQLLQIRQDAAQVDTTISIRSQGGSSALARGFSRGVRLHVQGGVAPGGGSLVFRASSGRGASRWQELRRGKTVLLLGGVPYKISQRGFLDVDWFRDLLPGPLLRTWPLLKNTRAWGSAEENYYRYQLQRFPRRALLRSLRVPLLRDLRFQQEGAIAALVLRRTGAPGGMIFEQRLLGKELDRLFGLGQASGIRSAQISIEYRVRSWKKSPPPVLPPRSAGGGRAALEVALLPFFVGLQGGELNAQGG